jgi:CMP-N,N'-diacetyllegionaminic acid synthase
LKVVAIIPARGGSKGIPRKNLVPIKDKPLVAYSIEHALSASTVQRTIVSSEDPDILETARKWGAETPFVRPQDLAGDDVLDMPVFEHALRYLREKEGYEPDLVVHLRPTTPFRKPGWIDAAVNALAASPTADSVRSVSPPEQHPYRVFRIGADGFLDPIMKHEHPVPYLLRRQELPPMYYYNCVIDVTRPATIFNKQSMTGDRILPWIMSVDDAFDIDTPRDLAIARALLESRSDFGGSNGGTQS